ITARRGSRQAYSSLEQKTVPVITRRDLAPSDPRPPICVVSITLPRSPVSLSSGDEVPHIFTRKSRLQPGGIVITSAKRLLQQYLPLPDSRTAAKMLSIRSPRRRGRAASAARRGRASCRFRGWCERDGKIGRDAHARLRLDFSTSASACWAPVTANLLGSRRPI